MGKISCSFPDKQGIGHTGFRAAIPSNMPAPPFFKALRTECLFCWLIGCTSDGVWPGFFIHTGFRVVFIETNKALSRALFSNREFGMIHFTDSTPFPAVQNHFPHRLNSLVRVRSCCADYYILKYSPQYGVTNNTN